MSQEWQRKREIKHGFLITEEEDEMLKTLCEEYHMSISGLIQMLISEKFDEVFEVN